MKINIVHFLKKFISQTYSGSLPHVQYRENTHIAETASI